MPLPSQRENFSADAIVEVGLVGSGSKIQL